MDKIWWKRAHNFLGLASALFLTMLLFTGILLNHSSFLEKGMLSVIAADPSDPAKIFSGKRDGLYRSIDSGKNWEEVPMLYPPQEIVDIVFSPHNPRQIYLLEKWGRIFKSCDGGKVWGVLPLPFDAQVQGIELKKLSVGTGEKLLLLTSNGWLSSSDEGKSWDETHFELNRKSLHRLVLTLHNGYFFGPAFVWVYDFSAAALFVLIVSGFILWKIGRSA